MAMIKCPKCGQEISDKSKKCVHCGNELIPEILCKKYCTECGKEVYNDALECPYCGNPLVKDEIEIKPHKNKNFKKIIIMASVIAFIAIISVIIVNIIKFHLNEDEKLAYKNAVKMQRMMRNPDSFKLYDDFIILKCHDDNGKVKYTYTIFKYGGENGYGAITTDEAIFRDNKYVMDYSEEPEEDDPDYLDKLGVKLDLAIYAYQGESNGTWERIDVNVEKIKHRMKLK